jgi:hypothetical protein
LSGISQDGRPVCLVFANPFWTVEVTVLQIQTPIFTESAKRKTLHGGLGIMPLIHIMATWPAEAIEPNSWCFLQVVKNDY